MSIWLDWKSSHLYQLLNFVINASSFILLPLYFRLSLVFHLSILKCIKYNNLLFEFSYLTHFVNWFNFLVVLKGLLNLSIISTRPRSFVSPLFEKEFEILSRSIRTQSFQWPVWRRRSRPPRSCRSRWPRARRNLAGGWETEPVNQRDTSRLEMLVHSSDLLKIVLKELLK